MKKYIDYNRELEEAIAKKHGSLQDFFKSRVLPGLGKTFVCIKCGKWVAPLVMKFYQFKVEEFKCYECQGRKKTR